MTVRCFMLEPDASKGARPVLRGGDCGDATPLPDLQRSCYVPASITCLVIGAADPPEMDAAYQAALTAALHQFASSGQLPYVKAILEKHPKLVNALREPNKKPYADDDYTLLHRAATSGNAELATYLISKGANLNSTAGQWSNGGGWAPLHYAARMGHLSVVKVLVKKAHGSMCEQAYPTRSQKRLTPTPHALLWSWPRWTSKPMSLRT